MKEKCRFCQGKNLKGFLKRKERNLVECQDCGLVFVSPFPTEAEVREIYTEEAFRKFNPTDKTRAGFGNYLEEEDLWREFLKKRIPLIKKFKTKGKLLDVGCGLGTFLEEARKARFKAYGVDIMDFAVDYCHQRGLEQVFKGTLEDNRFPDSSFDIVAAFHLLEHTWDPESFLAEGKRVLRPDGILMISVPDRRSMTARLLGKHWFGYHHYQHLFCFEKKTLVRYLEKNGFRVIEWGTEGLVWCLASNVLDRARLYYSNPILLKSAQLGENLLDFFNITGLPMLPGGTWLVAKKK